MDFFACLHAFHMFVTCFFSMQSACAVQVAAEKAAWEASKKDGFELVTICPTFVLGPVISNRADATSILDVKVLTPSTFAPLPY